MKLPKQPATLALIHQILGILVTALAIWLGNALFQVTSTVLTLVVGTGTIAAIASWRTEQPRWWIPIHMAFPISVLAASVLQIPAAWYLLGFILCAALFGTIHQTRVPYYPSRKSVWEALATLMDRSSPGQRFIDIGCGMGGCAKFIKKKYPQALVYGIELALLPWCICKLRTILQKNAPLWFFGDYQKLNFSDYDVIFSYLSPAAMDDLETKLSKELLPEKLFASLEFKLPNWKPARTIQTSAGTLYIYEYQ